MTGVSPGKPPADAPNPKAGCTLAANAIQQSKSGATSFSRISCTLSDFTENTLFLLLFGAKTADLRSKCTNTQRITLRAKLFPTNHRKFH
jgi:hypothetical protein